MMHSKKVKGKWQYFENNQRYRVAYEAASGIHFKYKEVDIEAINLGETE